MVQRTNPQGTIRFDYHPRPQFQSFHQRNQRWACIVAHRRAGKTVACVHDLITRALYSPRKNPQYGYVAPFRQQAKNIAWRYLKDATRPFATEIRESDLSVRLPNNALITLYGSDNPDALRGLYFDGLIVDEFGDCRAHLWAEVLLPTLADRKGWCVFIGTPKGKNQFYDFYELSKRSSDWFTLTLKADTSGILDTEEREQLKHQMSEEQYEQEFQCSFSAALMGTYYSHIIARLESNHQIVTPADNPAVAHDPDLPTFAATDLGYSDSTVFWFWQQRPDGISIIDCEAGAGNDLQYYFDLLDQKPYNYDTIYLPHDARAKTLQTGRSTIEQFQKHFSNTDTRLDIAPQLKVQHGIDATRMILPLCWFNLTTTSEGVEALRVYRRRYDDKNRTFIDHPLHDWSSDYADAFRYLSLVVNQRKKPQPTNRNPNDLQNDPSKSYYQAYSLHQLFADRERNKPKGVAKLRI